MNYGVGPISTPTEATMLLSYLPPESDAGMLLRTLWVLARPQRGDPTAHWVLTVGKFGTGDFEAVRAIPFQQGFPATPVRVSLTPEIRVLRGDMLALRVSPTSSAVPPLRNLSVIPEFADSTARR